MPSPLLSAISPLSKLITKWIDGTKGRRTRGSLLSYRSAVKRALKVHPSLIEDKYFMKYKDKGHTVTRKILKQSIDFLQEKESHLKASHELIKQIGYSMQHV